MRHHLLNYSAPNLGRVRRLRRERTLGEDHLRSFLRNRRLGFKFRFQHPVGRYVLDFYCAEAQLCVELDGDQHDPAKDMDRDQWLARQGILTYRISSLCLFGEDPTSLREHLERIQSLCERRAGRAAFPDGTASL